MLHAQLEKLDSTCSCCLLLLQQLDSPCCCRMLWLQQLSHQ
jgi:hypothetical protein